MFLTLLGSCAVVRPSQASDAEKDKQSDKWGSGIWCFSQRGSLVVERRTIVTASIGSMQCAWACIKTGMPSIIDLNFEVRHA